MNAICPMMSPFSTPRICPFLTMFITSYPRHGFATRSPSKRSPPRFDASFDEPMLLLDDSVEILHLPQFTPFWNGSFRLQFVEGLWIRRVFSDGDDPRSGAL